MSIDNKYVVSVMVADRPGILSGVTAAIADMGANIDDISQTVVEGYFSVILTATFTDTVESSGIVSAIESNFGANELSISVRPYTNPPKPIGVSHGGRYVMVVTGEDKPGIMKATTGFLAERSINIEDWSCNFDGSSVIYIGAITIPSGIDVKQVQVDLKSQMSDIGMRASIRHENIFRATNEVGPIKSLLK